MLESVSLKQVAVGLVVCLAVGGLAGRFLAPTKVVTKTETKTEVVEKEKIVYKEKEDSKTNKKNDKIIIKVETILPDGTRKIETKIIDKGSITIDMSREAQQEAEKQTETKTETKTEKIVENQKEGYRLALMVSPSYSSENLLKTPLSFGVQFDRRILGPFHLGVFGLSNKVVGLSAGVTF